MTITTRQLLQGKKRNLKNKKNPKYSCETSSFDPLEVAFLKLAKWIWFTPITVFSVCLFDAEQHVISSSQLNKTFWLFSLLKFKTSCSNVNIILQDQIDDAPIRFTTPTPTLRNQALVATPAVSVITTPYSSQDFLTMNSPMSSSKLTAFETKMSGKMMGILF